MLRGGSPIRDIAEKAGAGVGTVYRHFPQRSDLVVGVFRKEVDECASAAAELAAACTPKEALEQWMVQWMVRYVDFFVTKRGLAVALYSGDPALQTLPAYFITRLRPEVQALLDATSEAGDVRLDL